MAEDTIPAAPPEAVEALAAVASRGMYDVGRDTILNAATLIPDPIAWWADGSDGRLVLYAVGRGCLHRIAGNSTPAASRPGAPDDPATGSSRYDLIRLDRYATVVCDVQRRDSEGSGAKVETICTFTLPKADDLHVTVEAPNDEADQARSDIARAFVGALINEIARVAPAGR